MSIVTYERRDNMGSTRYIMSIGEFLFAYAKQHQVPVGTQGKLARAVTYLLNQEKVSAGISGKWGSADG